LHVLVSVGFTTQAPDGTHWFRPDKCSGSTECGGSRQSSVGSNECRDSPSIGTLGCSAGAEEKVWQVEDQVLTNYIPASQ